MARWIKTSVRYRRRRSPHRGSQSMLIFWSIARAMVRSRFARRKCRRSRRAPYQTCGSEWMSLSSPHARQTASSCSSVMPSMVPQDPPHRSPKSRVSCKNHAEETYILPVHIGDGYAVDRYAAAVDLKEPHEKIDHRCLARHRSGRRWRPSVREHLGEKSRMMILSGSLG